MRAPEHKPVRIADGVWLKLSPLDLPDDFPEPEPCRYLWELTGTPEHNGSRTKYFPASPNVSAIIAAGGGKQFHHATSVDSAIAAAAELHQRAISG
ncbi:hypothetical protein [Mycobacterium sp. 1245111.1]|uniref:hypothetical protein n=1 Tax=Mycobacterium sp. 1245111.1 TaxID=1834073 RepID=UPI0009F3202A|nr:hypothetical protein [Mycobacterium sp. 1245111.1]